MRRILVLVITIFAYINIPCAQQLQQVQERYIISTSLSEAELEEYTQRYFRQNVRSIFEELNLYSLRLPIGMEYAGEFEKHPEVSISADQKAELRAQPDDPRYNEQWGLQAIQSPELWEINTNGVSSRGDSIVIAILDRGFESDHEDLRDNLWKNKDEIPGNELDDDNNGYIDDYQGYDFDRDLAVLPVHAHGTEVSGVASASGNNKLGITGTNWSTKFMALAPASFVSDIIAGLEYAYEMRKKYNESNGARGAYVTVINNSFGFSNKFPEDIPELCPVYEKIYEVGILTVVSTPNSSIDIDEFGDLPTTCPSDGIIAVLGMSEDNSWDNRSGYGPVHVDIAAPARNILSTSLDDTYVTRSGTSLAAPFVSGAIAQLYNTMCDSLAELSLSNPQSVAASIKEAIMQSVELNTSYTGRSTTEGYLQVFEAYKNLQENCNVVNVEELSIANIFPNPVLDDMVTLDLEFPDFQEYQLDVFDVTGRQMYSETLIPAQLLTRMNVDISRWSAGVYLFSFRSADKKATYKLIVQ